MSSRFDLLTQELFQKNISECSLEQLQDLANEYPYFAPAQFALTKKLSEEASPAYEAQLQKAVLYFHEPLYFDHFFNQDKFRDSLPEVSEVAADVEEQEELENIEIPFVPPEEINEEAHDVPTEEENFEEPETPEAPELVVNNTEVSNPEPEPAPIDVIPPPVIRVDPAPEQAAKEPREKDDALAFEPYHTIDYFASQGIKLSQEEATKDNLGKQLKSFTEWLKTMKRLPVKEQIKHVDPVSEQKVEHLAAHSVEGADILTETMAEVWIKQGNIEKAEETYHKLSLLNPSKRAYFAAKIESIKRVN